MNSLREVPYVDMDHAVLAGGGYGGFMVNWIHGSTLARKASRRVGAKASMLIC